MRSRLEGPASHWRRSSGQRNPSRHDACICTASATATTTIKYQVGPRQALAHAGSLGLSRYDVKSLEQDADCDGPQTGGNRDPCSSR